MKRVELLSPAGDLERLKVTLLYGADAVYLGGKQFGLRANATNFTFEELEEGCRFAHSLNKKVYLTLNIVFHNDDINSVFKYIDDVVKCGVDAFIVSDISICEYIKKNYKSIEVHLSTQSSTMNYKAAEFCKNIGIDRIVLARELNKEEIKEIIDKTNMDIEVFIHGAMCTCVSGRCALSNYVTNRDANRGGCAQVCRFSFDTDTDKKFTLATKDLNMARYVTELIDMGVASLKVEGRMRSHYYLATVIGTYRKIIDDYYNNELTDEKLDSRILRDFNELKNKQFKNSLDKLLPKKLIPVIIQKTGINENKKVNEITKEERKKLIKELKTFKIYIKGFRPIEEAIITSGGINIKEINPKTMESKIVNGLYFAGEVIDVDSYTGGFNLQIAYSTGYTAGIS